MVIALLLLLDMSGPPKLADPVKIYLTRDFCVCKNLYNIPGMHVNDNKSSNCLPLKLCQLSSNLEKGSLWIIEIL
jgi:hypothetical protein